MAAALRFAARSVCVQGPQAYALIPVGYFTSAARQLLKPSSDGASKFRRLLASESTSFSNMPPPRGRLAKQVDVKKLELHNLLRLKEGLDAANSTSSMGAADNKELIQLIQGSNKDFFSSFYKSTAVTVAAIVASVYVEAKLIKAWNRRKYQSSDADVVSSVGSSLY